KPQPARRIFLSALFPTRANRWTFPMPSGRKTRTARNSRKGSVDRIHHETLEAPGVLSSEAQAEYDRLIAVLDSKGTLDRADLSTARECARLKGLLDQANATPGGPLDLDRTRAISIHGSQHRGRLRELGLTISPSRTLIRPNPNRQTSSQPDPWD